LTLFLSLTSHHHLGFVYVLKGEGNFGGTKATQAHTLVLSQGTQLEIHADEEVHFVILGGQVLHTPSSQIISQVA